MEGQTLHTFLKENILFVQMREKKKKIYEAIKSHLNISKINFWTYNHIHIHSLLKLLMNKNSWVCEKYTDFIYIYLYVCN